MAAATQRARVHCMLAPQKELLIMLVFIVFFDGYALLV